MKLLLFFCGIIVAVIGGPALNEDGLKSIAENLRKEVGVLNNELSQIEGETEAFVKSKIFEIEAIKTLQVDFNNALKDQKISPDCAASIDGRFHTVVAGINDELFKSAVKNLTGNEKSLEQSKQTLHDMKSVLLDTLDEEIKSCLADPAKCRLTGEYLDVTEDLFQLVDLQKYAIVESITRSSDYFVSKDLEEKVKKEIVEPFLECLKA